MEVIRIRKLGAALALIAVSSAASAAADIQQPSAPRSSEHDYDPPAPGSYKLPVVKAAADGALLDSKGASLRLRDIIGGRITVLSFIYTRCRDAKACPYATSVLNHLHRASVQDESLAKNIRLISMSFDPEHDTPARLAQYSEWVRDENSGCDWRFVTPGSTAELPSILTAYGQVVDQKQNASDPQGPFNHMLRVYLIDRQRRIRNIYSTGTLDPRLVLADVKTLLMEEARFGR